MIGDTAGERCGATPEARGGKVGWLRFLWERTRRRYFPPLIRQHDQTDCGPAALLSVLHFWGGDLPLAELRSLSGTDLRGSNLAGLLRAGEAIGFRARGATGTVDELRGEALPAIAHVVLPDGTPHFVVVYRITSKAIAVGDPARGRGRIARHDFEAIWPFRAVLLLEPTPDLRNDRVIGWIPWLAAHCRSEPAWL
jgi:ABC-type bacteriocin/lantibiotic exporter with double-glycine peptidase domain